MRMPKPSVASARNTRETRTAGMATTAPTGTATSAARISENSQGMPSPAKCPKAAAPTAANARWHSEICPERRTSRPSDRNRMMLISAADQTPTLPDWMTGITASRPSAITPAASRIRGGAT